MMNSTKLELDSSTSREEVLSLIQQHTRSFLLPTSTADAIHHGKDDSSISTTPAAATELHLNCFNVDFDVACALVELLRVSSSRRCRRRRRRLTTTPTTPKRISSTSTTTNFGKQESSGDNDDDDDDDIILEDYYDYAHVWKLMDLEECTGDGFCILLQEIFTMGNVEKIKLASLGLGALPTESIYAMAMGMAMSTSMLQDLTLSMTLSAQDAQLLTRGLLSSSSSSSSSSSGKKKKTALRRFCLWDATLVEDEAATILAQGLRAASALEEFGFVACASQCETRLDTLLRAFHHHEKNNESNNDMITCTSSNRVSNSSNSNSNNTEYGTESNKNNTSCCQLKQLDLRCLASGIGPVAQLLRCNQSLQTLDLSFRSGEAHLDVELLGNAIVQSSSLRALHVCGNYIQDDGFQTLLEAAQRPTCVLQTLNVSLNKITNIGISILSQMLLLPDNHHQDDNNDQQPLKLKRILLDGNPIQDPPWDLVNAIQYNNTYLEECLIPAEFENVQQQLHYWTQLNRGGRRLVFFGNNQGHQHHHPRRKVPPALWPLVLERANRLELDQHHQHGHHGLTADHGRAEIIYCLLQGGPLFFPT